MKSILFFLLFLPVFSYSQNFHYTKIVNGKDTVEKKGLFLISEYNIVTEYTLFPEPAFGVNEFTNISFLVVGRRVFIRTKDLVYFKEFLATDYFIEYKDKIVIGTENKEIQFLK